jgi:F-type H+-transporting ATPase subunit delta
MPSTKGVVARRYAEALFGLAMSHGLPCAEKWDKDLRMMAEVLDNDDNFRRYLESPKIPFTKKRDLLARAFGSAVDRELVNTFSLLVQSNRVATLKPVAEEYQSMLKEKKGIVTAFVTTAIPLPPDRERELANRLSSLLGKTVEIKPDVDPAIIGGLVIRVGDRLIDGSLVTKIAKLRDSLV